MGERQGVGGLDGANHEPGVERGEGLEVEPANGEQDAVDAELAKPLGCVDRVVGVVPLVARLAFPFRSHQPQPSDARPSRRLGGLAGHGSGEGVGGIDQNVNGVRLQVTNQALDAAEAAGAHRAGIGQWLRGAAGERRHHRHTRLGGQQRGQLAGLAGAGQQQDVHGALRRSR